MKLSVSGGFETTIDDADADLIKGYSISHHKAGRKVYARLFRVVSGKRELVYLHRLITGAAVGMDVDHVNGDGLDNRRANLRVTTRTVNNLNRPDSKGCYFEARTGRWRADLWVNKRRIRLGRFDTFEAANAAYRERRAIEMASA